jgi:hypothetical protein
LKISLFSKGTGSHLLSDLSHTIFQASYFKGLLKKTRKTINIKKAKNFWAIAGAFPIFVEERRFIDI